MPAASFLLPLLARLLHLIPSLLGLLPVLLRTPPPASGFFPFAPPLTPLVPRLPPLVPRLPPFAPRLPPLALRRLAFVVSLSNHTRLRRRTGHRPPASCLAPATPGPARIHSSCPDSPQTTPKSAPPQHPSYPRTRVSTPTTVTPQTTPKYAPPRPPRHSGVFSRNPVFVPRRTSGGPKNAPRQPKSFLEKTLTARESARSAPRTAPGLALETGRSAHCHIASPR